MNCVVVEYNMYSLLNMMIGCGLLWVLFCVCGFIMIWFVLYVLVLVLLDRLW